MGSINYNGFSKCKVVRAILFLFDNYLSKIIDYVKFGPIAQLVRAHA